MKAKAVKLIYGKGYVHCEKEDATHITINIPGPTGLLTLPVITKGSRKDKFCWSWNGCLEKPTLKPSVLTNGHNFRCHSWITDGKAIFLNDCDHDLKDKTVTLNDVPA